VWPIDSWGDTTLYSVCLLRPTHTPRRCAQWHGDARSFRTHRRNEHLEFHYFCARNQGVVSKRATSLRLRLVIHIYHSNVYESTSGLPRFIWSRYDWLLDIWECEYILQLLYTVHHPRTAAIQYTLKTVSFTTLVIAELFYMLGGLLIDYVGGSSEPIDTRVRRPKLKTVSSRSSVHYGRTYNHVRRGSHCLLVDDVRGSFAPIATCDRPTLKRLSSRVSFHDSRTYRIVRRRRHCLFFDNVGGSIVPSEFAIPPLKRVSWKRHTGWFAEIGIVCGYSGGRTVLAVANGLLDSDRLRVRVYIPSWSKQTTTLIHRCTCR
jgi:hypothetical protein